MNHASRRLAFLAVATLCNAAALCDVSTAQQADSDEPAGRQQLSPQQIAEDLPFRLAEGELHVAELVDRVADQLGHNYLYDQRMMAQDQNTIVLQSPVVFENTAELEVFLCRMLWSKSFVRVPFGADDKTWEVLSLQGPRRGEMLSRARFMTPDQVVATRDLILPVQCSVPMLHIQAQQAANALRPFLAQSSTGMNQVISVGLGQEGPVLLQGLAPQVAAAVDLLRQADADAKAQQTAMQAQVATLQQQVEALTKQLAELRAALIKSQNGR